MCDPVTVGATLVSMAGAHMKERKMNKYNQRRVDARNNAYQASLDRQQEHREDAASLQRDNIQAQGREGFDEKYEAQVAKRKESFSSKQPEAPNYNAPKSAPKNVRLARETESAEANAEADRNATNLAFLGGFTGASADQGMSRGAFVRGMTPINSAARGDANLMGLEMRAAENNVKQPNMLFPNLLQMAGSAGAMYGASNPGTLGTFGDGGVSGVETVVRPTAGQFGHVGPQPLKPGLFSQAQGYFG